MVSTRRSTRSKTDAPLSTGITMNGRPPSRRKASARRDPVLEKRVLTPENCPDMTGVRKLSVAARAIKEARHLAAESRRSREKSKERADKAASDSPAGESVTTTERVMPATFTHRETAADAVVDATAAADAAAAAAADAAGLPGILSPDRAAELDAHASVDFGSPSAAGDVFTHVTPEYGIVTDGTNYGRRMPLPPSPLIVPGRHTQSPLSMPDVVDMPHDPPAHTYDMTPLREAPADEAPASAADAIPSPPRTEAPADEAPADEAPADEAPADEAPADEAPADEAPADEAPADEAPADDTGAGANDDTAPNVVTTLVTDALAEFLAENDIAVADDTEAPVDETPVEPAPKRRRRAVKRRNDAVEHREDDAPRSVPRKRKQSAPKRRGPEHAVGESRTLTPAVRKLGPRGPAHDLPESELKEAYDMARLVIERADPDMLRTAYDLLGYRDAETRKIRAAILERNGTDRPQVTRTIRQLKADKEAFDKAARVIFDEDNRRVRADYAELLNAMIALIRPSARGMERSKLRELVDVLVEDECDLQDKPLKWLNNDALTTLTFACEALLTDFFTFCGMLMRHGKRKTVTSDDARLLLDLGVMGNFRPINRENVKPEGGNILQYTDEPLPRPLAAAANAAYIDIHTANYERRKAEEPPLTDDEKRAIFASNVLAATLAAGDSTYIDSTLNTEYGGGSEERRAEEKHVIEISSDDEDDADYVPSAVDGYEVVDVDAESDDGAGAETPPKRRARKRRMTPSDDEDDLGYVPLPGDIKGKGPANPGDRPTAAARDHDDDGEGAEAPPKRRMLTFDDGYETEDSMDGAGDAE